MSDWKERARKRREERQTKVPEPIRPPGGSKRNTKRWCRGVVGREHKLECRPYTPGDTGIFKGWRILACVVCGKQVDHYYASALGRRNNPKPDWVTS